MQPFIEIRELEYAYPVEGGGQTMALCRVDLTIGRGEFVSLIGPNGSGKSTLARHLNGLLLPTAGQVRVDGLSSSDPRHLWRIRQKVGMVFQNPENQIVASTVEEDVAFGPENAALPPQEIRTRVDEALDAVGLRSLRTSPPEMLSGGQKQLLAIAGALATRPACIVLDEPTSMLDPPGRRQILDTLLRLNGQEGITVVLITQSMEEAAAARRVLVMDEGRIVMDGPPEAVFARNEDLQALGLDVPSMAKIALRLLAQGVRLPPGLLSVQALAGALAERPQA